MVFYLICLFILGRSCYLYLPGLLLQRIIRVSLKLNLTSIADLLAARFGKSHRLAIMVTLGCFDWHLCLISRLQLKAIVYSFQQLQAEQTLLMTWSFGLIVALVLAGFTIMFGIRNIDVTERHPGVMLAIAFESLSQAGRLFGGWLVCYVLFVRITNGYLATKSNANVKLEEQLTVSNFTGHGRPC